MSRSNRDDMASISWGDALPPWGSISLVSEFSESLCDLSQSNEELLHAYVFEMKNLIALMDLMPTSAELKLAFRKLQESVFWIRQGLAKATYEKEKKEGQKNNT